MAEPTSLAAARMRRQHAIGEQLRIQRLVAASWVLDGALLVALVWLAGSGFLVPVVYLAIGLSSTAVAAFLLQSGRTDRFADPTMSYPLMLVAVLNQCIGLWLAPEVGVFFLMNIFQVLAYGLISLRAAQFRMLVVLASLVAVVPIMVNGHLVSFPAQTWTGKFLLFAAFVLCLARFVGVGAFVSSLRARIEHKKAELAESEARFRALTELSSDWYWEQDAKLRFTHIASGNRNPALPENEMMGKRVWECGFELEMEGGWAALSEIIQRRGEFREVLMKRADADQRVYYLSASGQAVFDRKGEFRGYRGVAREVTEQRLAEEHIQYLATHDGLTGLPNRLMFGQLLGSTIESSRRYARRFAVLFLDLDGFKLINDSLGHEAGDALLKELALRFRNCLRASDTVARLGGDEFVVLAAELDAPGHAAAIARKLLDAAASPVMLRGLECRVSASVGVALFPEDAIDEGGLMKCADGAMYAAKQRGKNCFEFHSSRPVATTVRTPAPRLS